jgi:hypothetical protein
MPSVQTSYSTTPKLQTSDFLEYTLCIMDSGATKKGYDMPQLGILQLAAGERQGWTLLQFIFTVGVRGSISSVDRTEPLSFTSTLKALGIISRVNLEKIRKAVAKHTFEAHDLMLRSYYAGKFSSSSHVDF